MHWQCHAAVGKGASRNPAETLCVVAGAVVSRMDRAGRNDPSRDRDCDRAPQLCRDSAGAHSGLGEGGLRAHIVIRRPAFSAILYVPTVWFFGDSGASSGLFRSHRPRSPHDSGPRRIRLHLCCASGVREQPFVLRTGPAAHARGRETPVPHLASSTRRQPCAETRMSDDDRPSGRPAGRRRPLVSTSPSHVTHRLRITW